MISREEVDLFLEVLLRRQRQRQKQRKQKPQLRDRDCLSGDVCVHDFYIKNRVFFSF
jgi:hypothetical protein